MMESVNFNPRGKALYSENGVSFSFFDLIFIILLVILLALMIFVSMFSKCEIHQTSMMNTLYDGDNILITNYKTVYKNSDVIVLDAADSDGNVTRLVKRIVATEGEQFYFQTIGGYVYLYKKSSDGSFQSIAEPYLPEYMKVNFFSQEIFSFYNPLVPSTIYTVPEGSVLYLGDNRNVSIDSRHYSYAKVGDIVGKMVCKIENGSFLDLLVNILFSKAPADAFNTQTIYTQC